MKQSKNRLKIRIIIPLCCFMLLFIALISRAVQLQIVSGTTLEERGKRQHIRSWTPQPERGIILERNGEKMAASIMVDSVYADPANITNAQKVSVDLSSILGLNRRKLLSKISDKGNFCWIARKISPEQARKINELKDVGIYLIKEPKRFYTNRELACHLLGFVGLDSQGLEGLELKYDSYLKSVPQKMTCARDARGNKIYLDRDSVYNGENPAYSLILTIDKRIQYITELQLNNAIKETDAKSGTSIVMDPKTGEILAMANVPYFNPNNFFKFSAETRRNRAITDCLDPGSIFKPFLAAAALEEGVIQENDILNCENGAYVVGNRTIHEAQRKKHKKLTFREVLKYSSNIGSVKVAERLGKDKFYHYITEFGFGSKTGIDLPGEVSGILRKPHSWRSVDFATIAFGQGVSVTPLQLVTAMSSIANQGVLMKPYIVRGIIDKRGQIVKEYTPTAVRRVISVITAERIASILTSVVQDEDGTGQKARISDVSVAGKTGTSQKFDFASKRYSSKKIIASFLGFFPAEDPQFVILVSLDEPKINRWGGQAAAPVFKNIAEQLLRRFNKNIKVCREIVKDNEDNNEIKVLQVSSPVVITHDSESRDNSIIPDFRGMTMKQVLKLCDNRGIQVKMLGSGWAIRQNPDPGTSIRNHPQCKILFSPRF